jgi:hypothetical protein
MTMYPARYHADDDAHDCVSRQSSQLSLLLRRMAKELDWGCEHRRLDRRSPQTTGVVAVATRHRRATRNELPVVVVVVVVSSTLDP